MHSHPSRRQFVKSSGLAAGLLALSSAQVLAQKTSPTIQQVIDTIIKNMTGAPLPDTVDVIKQGDPAQAVTGITTTFLATFDLLKKAVERGHNLVITHEPVFYSHLDKTEWLQDHAVYQAKRDFIAKHKLVVWRCHDYIHAKQPDGIYAGMTAAFGWQQYVDPQNPILFHLPPQKLADVISHIKKTFNLPAVRIVGDPNLTCTKVALMVGAPGAEAQINTAQALEPDVLICGEISEWTTNVYFQDAITAGRKTALVIMGHAPSEEAGMVFLATWLQKLFPAVEIAHQPSGLGYVFM